MLPISALAVAAGEVAVPVAVGRVSIHEERPSTGITRWVWATKVMVRPYVSPEPLVAGGAEESY